MHFTHTPASSSVRASRRARHHVFTDVHIEWPSRAAAVRIAYRILRKRGISPDVARGVLWDTAVAAGAETADHDLRYS